MNRSPVFSEFDNDFKSFLLNSKFTSPIVTKTVKNNPTRDILSEIFSNKEMHER